MNICSLALGALAAAVLTFSCDSASQSTSPIRSKPAAHVPSAAGGRAPFDSGTRTGDGEPTQHDAATVHTTPESSSHDSGRAGAAHATDPETQTRSDAGRPDEDAGVDEAPVDSGVTPPSTPRSDGCPEDAPLALDRVRVLAAKGQNDLIAGARIQGSNSSPTTDFVDLARIELGPAEGEFVEISLQNTKRFRYLRYYAPPGSQGGVTELEFYHGGRRLEGDAFGTATAQLSFHGALDGDPLTHFAPAANGGGYVGLDIARGYLTAPVVFSPAGAAFESPVEVTLASSTPGAVIRYTDDGTEPTSTNGETYTQPVQVSEGRVTLSAFASSDCRFDSSIQSATYTSVPATEPTGRGLRTYHLGNSLTDTINPWLEPIADSTGVDHVYARWTIPGAPIRWLAQHQGEGFEDPEGAASFDSFVESFAPIDHLSLQPFSDPAFDSQGGAAVDLLSTALRFNPEIQFWIYAQWSARSEWASEAFASGGGSVYPDWTVPQAPTSWEDATRNAALYFEEFRDRVDARIGGKPLLIVPGGLALVELKRRIETGAVPGLADFFGTMFEDEIHLTKPAQYLVALVFYACLYRQSPEGRVTSAGTGLTPQQALIFQQIAWTVASEYAGSGVRPQ
jgi:Chitobiase/beta-hexosaminidase C-terminal domain